MAAPGTVAFDVVGTLFGLDKPRSRLIELGAPPHGLELWLFQSLRDYMGISHAGGYVPLKDVLASTLPRLLATFSIQAQSEDVDGVLAAFKQLEASDGAQDACEALTASGWKTVALTNGAEDMTWSLIERAGLEKHFSSVLSCDSIRIAKPHPDAYAMAKKEAEGDLWLVAAHGWDITGAKRAGLKAAWVSNMEGHFAEVHEPYDIEARDLPAAVEQILRTAS